MTSLLSNTFFKVILIVANHLVVVVPVVGEKVRTDDQLVRGDILCPTRGFVAGEDVGEELPENFQPPGVRFPSPGNHPHFCCHDDSCYGVI